MFSWQNIRTLSGRHLHNGQKRRLRLRGGGSGTIILELVKWQWQAQTSVPSACEPDSTAGRLRKPALSGRLDGQVLLSHGHPEGLCFTGRAEIMLSEWDPGPPTSESPGDLSGGCWASPQNQLDQRGCGGRWEPAVTEHFLGSCDPGEAWETFKYIKSGVSKEKVIY